MALQSSLTRKFVRTLIPEESSASAENAGSGKDPTKASVAVIIVLRHAGE